MSVSPDVARVEVAERPRLVFFDSSVSGRCRRATIVVEGRRIRRRILAPDGCRAIEEELRPWLR